MRAARVGARMAGMKRGHIHARSWDKAVAAMRAELRALPNYSRMTAAGRRMLAAVDALCAELTARRYLAWCATNAELAKKYGVSLRTITNWRREGCPFDGGQPRVLGWLAGRRYAPAGAKAKFAKQLRRRKSRADFKGGFQALRADILDLRMRHKRAGAPMPDWLRGMPFRAR